MTAHYLTFKPVATAVFANHAALNIVDEDFTICFWVKMASVGITTQLILTKYQGTGHGLTIYVPSGDLITLRLYDTPYTPTFAANSKITDGFWHHVAWSFARGAVADKICYIDGAENSQCVDDTTGDLSNTFVLKLAHTNFAGSLDDFRLYKGEALNAAAIVAIYAAGTGVAAVDGDFTDGFYTAFDDGSGTTLSGRRIEAGTPSAHNSTAMSSANITWVSGGVPNMPAKGHKDMDKMILKYGEAATVRFPLCALGTQTLTAGLTPATTDAKVSLDGATFTDTATFAATTGGLGFYDVDLTAAELSAAEIVLKVVDVTSPKAWNDYVLMIETYGNASARYPSLAQPRNQMYLK